MFLIEKFGITEKHDILRKNEKKVGKKRVFDYYKLNLIKIREIRKRLKGKK
jgi:hypothetical protein